MTDPTTPGDDQGLPKAPPIDFPPPSAAPQGDELATYGARVGGYLLDGLLPHVKSSAKPDSLPHLEPPDGGTG
jgi:hypothetical protein